MLKAWDKARQNLLPHRHRPSVDHHHGSDQGNGSRILRLDHFRPQNGGHIKTFLTVSVVEHGSRFREDLTQILEGVLSGSGSNRQPAPDWPEGRALPETPEDASLHDSSDGAGAPFTHVWPGTPGTPFRHAEFGSNRVPQIHSAQPLFQELPRTPRSAASSADDESDSSLASATASSTDSGTPTELTAKERDALLAIFGTLAPHFLEAFAGEDVQGSVEALTHRYDPRPRTQISAAEEQTLVAIFHRCGNTFIARFMGHPLEDAVRDVIERFKPPLYRTSCVVENLDKLKKICERCRLLNEQFAGTILDGVTACVCDPGPDTMKPLPAAPPSTPQPAGSMKPSPASATDTLKEADSPSALSSSPPSPPPKPTDLAPVKETKEVRETGLGLDMQSLKDSMHGVA